MGLTDRGYTLYPAARYVVIHSTPPPGTLLYTLPRRQVQPHKPCSHLATVNRTLSKTTICICLSAIFRILSLFPLCLCRIFQCFRYGQWSGSPCPCCRAKWLPNYKDVDILKDYVNPISMQ